MSESGSGEAREELGTEDELVQALLQRFNDGDPEAREQLFQLVAEELHGLARRAMRKQAPGHTLQATALVSEAYIKLFGREPRECRDKAHLLRAAARAMRQVLQDHARRKFTRRRAQPGRRVDLDSSVGAPADESAGSFLHFSDEVERLSRVSPDMARAMELHYILGFSKPQIARVLHIPERTFDRKFEAAEALLATRLG